MSNKKKVSLFIITLFSWMVISSFTVSTLVSGLVFFGIICCFLINISYQLWKEDPEIYDL